MLSRLQGVVARPRRIYFKDKNTGMSRSYGFGSLKKIVVVRMILAIVDDEMEMRYRGGGVRDGAENSR